MAWKVTFDGFETQEQAQAFADWYEGQGEQNSDIWLEEHTDLTYANSDSETVLVADQTIVVGLKLYHKDESKDTH